MTSSSTTVVVPPPSSEEIEAVKRAPRCYWYCDSVRPCDGLDGCHECLWQALVAAAKARRAFYGD
jgi:hypothetical protein